MPSIVDTLILKKQYTHPLVKDWLEIEKKKKKKPYSTLIQDRRNSLFKQVWEKNKTKENPEWAREKAKRLYHKDIQKTRLKLKTRSKKRHARLKDDPEYKRKKSIISKRHENKIVIFDGVEMTNGEIKRLKYNYKKRLHYIIFWLTIYSKYIIM
jgi:hypothetical protein